MAPPPPPAAASRSSWRAPVLTALVLTATAVVVVANRSELPAGWRALRHARPGWFAVALGLSGAGLLDLAVEHTAAQRALGLRPRLAWIAPRAWAARFLNLVAKSGGLAGLAVFRRSGRRAGQSDGPVVAAYLLATVLDPLAFAALLAVALGSLVAEGRFSAVDAAGTAVFAAYLFVTVGVVVAALRSRGAVRALYAVPANVAARFGRGRGGRSVPDHKAADGLYEAVSVLRRRPGAAWAPALAALGVDVIGVAELWAVLLAVDAHPAVTVPVVAYALSTLFGIVGMVPGGLGVVEVSLGAVLVSSGLAVGKAGAAVVLFRLVELWLPLVAGGVAVARLSRLEAGAG